MHKKTKQRAKSFSQPGCGVVLLASAEVFGLRARFLADVTSANESFALAAVVLALAFVYLNLKTFGIDDVQSAAEIFMCDATWFVAGFV